MIVIFSPEAETDLEEIGDHIAVDAPERAYSFVRELRDRCQSLATMPESFPVVILRPGEEIRRRPYRRYSIFYRLSAGNIQILRVLHLARDHERLLFPEA